MITSFALALVATLAPQQPACEGLKALSLPKTTITTAEFRPAGAAQPGRGRGAGAQLPAHCRVAAVLAPSSDSHIEMELWMPVENWNGKFLAVGNGGWAGNIETGAMGTALESRLCDGFQRHRPQSDEWTRTALCAWASGKGHRFRISCDARNDRPVEGPDSVLLQTRSAALLLSRLLNRRPSGTDRRRSAIPKTLTRSLPERPSTTRPDLHASQMSLMVEMLKTPESIALERQERRRWQMPFSTLAINRMESKDEHR